MAMDIEIRRAGIEELAVLIEWRMRVLSEVFAANKDADCSFFDLYNDTAMLSDMRKYTK